MDPIFTGLKSVLTNYYDFYLLEAMSAEEVNFSSAPQKKWKNDLTKWKKEIIDDTALAIRDYLYLICCGEARHAWNMANLAIIELKKHKGKNRTKTYITARNFGPTEENIQRLIDIFAGTWRGSGFGGKKWLQIAQAITLYGKKPNEIFIDHAASLQHNGGGVFSKKEVKTIIDFHLNLDRNTLQKWFYSKANINILEKGNPGSLITATTKTKKLLNAFFITRKLDKPEWLLSKNFSTITMEHARYKPIKWGNKTWSKPIKTGSTWEQKKAIWPCICESCIYMPPIEKEQAKCKNCKNEFEWCECCNYCGSEPDYCTMCELCGEHNCKYCYICSNQTCEYKHQCCENCEQKENECTCCTTCHNTEDKYLYCEICGDNKCQHPNLTICCEECKDSPCTCKEKETINEKKIEKEEEKENQGVSNNKNADIIKTQTSNVGTMPQR